MKTPSLSLSLLLAVNLAGTTVRSQETETPARRTQPMRESARHDDLSNRLRMEQQKDPIRGLGPAIGKTDEDPSLRTTSRDLIKESTILCYRGFLTLVPKKAVIHLPEKLKDRFEPKDKVQVQTWADFYQANRGWIRTLEVTREQAMGQVPLAEEVVAAFQESSSVVVATFKGGPISVIPYKEPVPEGEAEKPATLSSNTTESTEKP